MNNPSISVIMSAYNVEKYIGEAIESILNQTFKDFEFIIIDDASTDNTLSVIKTYKDERIKFFKNENNSGPAFSHNKSLKIATGKYIALMDADDISHPRRFEKLYEFLEKNHQVDVCGSFMKLFGAENNIWKYKSNDKEIKAGLVWGSTMPHGTVLMRRDIINRHHFHYDESLRLGEDFKFWYDIKDKVKFSNLEETLYYYRRGEQNITLKFSNQSKERHAAMHRIILTDLGIQFSEEELLLHQFIVGLFSIPPSPETVRKARLWLNKLMAYNRKEKAYDVPAFEKISSSYWSQLFFKLVPYGMTTVLSYFKVSGISQVHLSYYLKFSLNNLIGRK